MSMRTICTIAYIIGKKKLCISDNNNRLMDILRICMMSNELPSQRLGITGVIQLDFYVYWPFFVELYHKDVSMGPGYYQRH